MTVALTFLQRTARERQQIKELILQGWEDEEVAFILRFKDVYRVMKIRRDVLGIKRKRTPYARNFKNIPHPHKK